MTGKIFIFSAPSGGGKSSLANALVDQSPEIGVSISHTTRQPRPGEENGVHYHFVSTDEFHKLKSEDQFLEFAQVFDNFYGTTHAAVKEILDQGKHVLLDVDWQGMQSIKKKVPEAISVFILPPSRDALRERLNSRGQDDEQTINRRMQDAVSEMRHYPEFDYVVVNDNFNLAVADLQAIVYGFPDQVRTAMPDMEQLLADV